MAELAHNRLDTLATFYLMEALLESGNSEKALEVVKKIIKEAETKRHE